MDELLVILDLDGTLIKSQEVHLSSFIYGIKKIKEHVNKEMIEEMKNKFGLPGKKIIQTAVPEANNTTINIMHKSAKHYLKNHVKDIELFKEAKNFLERISKKHKLVLATSSQKSFTKKVLKNNKILKYFDKIYTIEEVNKPKPDPEILNNIIREYDYDIKKVVYVGDSIYDYKAARSAGVRFIAVLNNSYSAERLIKSGCKTVNTLNEINL